MGSNLPASRQDEEWMRQALDQAALALGRTSPNPAVGAVVVKNGRVIGVGHTQPVGSSHAEVVALKAAGSDARNADLYTTLEPCDHFGRTPPCSLAIFAAGIRRVVTASSDPNPLVDGRGVERLRRLGIGVATGILREEADQLNAPFFKAVTSGLPFVTLKVAASLDGKIAARGGDSRWVTGGPARTWVHQLRNRIDAILIGANTVRADNPRLTTRLPQGGGRDALRVVLDSHLRLSPRQAVFRQRSKARTVVATLESPTSLRARRLASTGVEVWKLPSENRGVDPRALLRRLQERGINHVLVEGGAQLFTSLIRHRLVDELLLFTAPKLVGGDGLPWLAAIGVGKMAEALTLHGLSSERVGDDVLIRARFR